MELLNGSTSPRKTTRSSMDLTSQLSHLTAPHWAWKDGYGEYGEYGRGMDMGNMGNVRMKFVLIYLGGSGISFALSNTYTLHRLR
ncbi:unnamed protein product [Penicillium camemberti]|uniref:Str. FM013 n=1 Tax=Penicillium camemberti (strain FM 013) TaxID=1429867 RepID=A0A0G4PPI0_PENC3|nr:unnamed protein product [Penicillium camemberti]